MGRIKRDARIDTRTQRAKLAARSEPYWTSLEPRRHLGFRKGAKGAGMWVAKLYDPELKPDTQQRTLGVADDLAEADGRDILSFAQAQAVARKWIEDRKRLAELEANGEIQHTGPYTVSDAMTDYLKDAELRGMKSLHEARTTIKAHILPELGAVQVSKLSRRRIQEWHLALAARPRRKAGKLRDATAFLEGPRTEDEKRARKATANRILATLKAALNHAYKEDRITGLTPWREAGPFKAVTSARTRFLSANEQRRLISACEAEFRDLVVAALMTGCRYGELTRLRMRDFDELKGQVFVAPGKTSKSRWVVLTPEGAKWFQAKIAGQPGEALLLTRGVVRRTTRAETLDEGAWGSHDQKPLMDRACETACLERLTFHELRHTYASALVNKGMPLLQVAALLGHSDTRMVERHYGHLCPRALEEAVRQYGQSIGLEPYQHIQTLAIQASSRSAPEEYQSASLI